MSVDFIRRHGRGSDQSEPDGASNNQTPSLTTSKRSEAGCERKSSKIMSVDTMEHEGNR